MDFSWINTSPTSLLMVLISCIGIYVALIIYTRIAGLRSFSKMSSFDFAITVAIGSIIASTILTKSPPLLQAMIALGILYALQMSVASLRNHSSFISDLVDNKPLLLMNGTHIIEKNMQKAKVTHDDLRAKLREANITQLSQVKAVVMEATGDVSVLHHHDSEHQLDSELLKEVEGYSN
ncbi:DUF421 domain-containing protein [Gracilimonas mengyeensis]|uniref:Uncharacterized membrane protein YcaP, DUF421 family n=1 Tax=Gracilimonas mengyeensis TaxID=1302730 RepID=A0A521DPC4_9BACT|nr:YetF domain-containing protein [Gracilimonas mengyeensis]SMO73478.1 Uncharacterized membrane protein YcaP, DUF421 family [Gracilimonas mengyeensis]